MPVSLFLLFALSVIVELFRFRNQAMQKIVLTVFGSMMRKEEHAKISGWTWAIGAAFLCTIFFGKYPHISFIVLTLFIMGDAVAALVGIGIGRIKLGKKTLEGSLACFFTCVVLFYILFPLVPGLLESWDGRIPIIIAFVTALIITIFELIPLKITKTIVINDNLAVPVIAGYAMIGLEKILF
jgi:dolichol kinase